MNQNTDKKWLKIDPQTGTENQRKCGPELMLKRNPDLAQWWEMTGLPGEAYNTQWILCAEYIHETKQRWMFVSEDMTSSHIAEQVSIWAAQKFAYHRQIHAAAVIGAALTCGISYKRLPVTKTVIIALAEKF